MTSSNSPANAIPRWARWTALIWLATWGTAYAWVWGWTNFLHLCDIAVILTCAGIWLRSSLLISMQAVSSLLVSLFWDLDFACRLLLGRHCFGGTEYLWDSRFPLAVRLLSLFHVVWPVLLLWLLRKVRYDPRALRLQSIFAVVVLILSRWVGPEVNLNFAYRDPFLHISLGPGALHLVSSAAILIVVAYWPTHWLLARLFPAESGGRNKREAGGRLRTTA